MFELEGKSVLVNGAGRGVCPGIALAWAVQGAPVVMSDLFPDGSAEACHPVCQQGLAAEHCAFDVTDYAQVSAAVSALGTIDMLVNNAGIPGVKGMELKQIIDKTPAEWRLKVHLNLYGTLYCTHALLPGMRDRGLCRIVIVCADAGRAGSGAGVTIYGSCTAAAVQLVRNSSQEVAALGVRVNAIALGPMDNLPDEYAKWTVRTIPVARMGRPDDAGAAVVDLASEEAGRATGQLLAVNGGMNPS